MPKSDFHRFYETHLDRVYRFVLFRVGLDKEVAQDLTSEIFIKALQAYEKYDEERGKSAWIMTIARNHLINHYRDKKQTADIDDLAFELVGSDLREDSLRDDDVRFLNEAMKELPEKDRELIEWKYLQGFRYREIGQMIGKSAGAVRIEGHRAMKKLKEILTTMYEKRGTKTQ